MQSQVPSFSPFPNAAISAMSFQPSIQSNISQNTLLPMQTRVNKYQVEVPVEVPVPIEIPVQVPLYYDVHVNQTAYNYDDEEEEYLYEYLLQQSQALDRLLSLKYQQMAPPQILPAPQVAQPQVLPVQYIMQPPIYVEYQQSELNQQPQPQPQVRQVQKPMPQPQQAPVQQKKIFETRQPSIIPKTHQQPKYENNSLQLQNSSYLKK